MENNKDLTEIQYSKKIVENSLNEIEQKIINVEAEKKDKPKEASNLDRTIKPLKQLAKEGNNLKEHLSTLNEDESSDTMINVTLHAESYDKRASLILGKKREEDAHE